MADLNWRDEQRNFIEQAIADEIESSRLAHKIIPEFKLKSSDRAVGRDRYNYANNTIDEQHNDLLEVVEPFMLTKLQTEDDDLDLARMRVRRAAQQLARHHDEEVFRVALRDDINANAGNPGFHAVVNIDVGDPSNPNSDRLIPAVANAIAALDGEGYRAGFVMVAGQDVYTLLHMRAPGAADIPLKAVQSLFEGGPIHRSAVLPTEEALLLSITGDSIDRAVAVPPTLEFLRIGNNENREFRLYERFLPRFKLTYSAVLLRLVSAQQVHQGRRAASQQGDDE